MSAAVSEDAVRDALASFSIEHKLPVWLSRYRAAGLYVWVCDGDVADEPTDLPGILDQITRWHNRLTNERHLRINQASQIKSGRRGRPFDPEVKRRRSALLEIIEAQYPMTVRQVFYQATVKGLVEKTEGGYNKIQNDLVLLRRSGELPYGHLTDSTRYLRKPRSFRSAEHAIQHTAQFYRRDLWASADAYVEVWIEKDALSGVVYPITAEYDVPLYPARGYSSLSFLHGAAEYIADLEVPVFIYHLGDHDPSGVNAGEKIEETLREFAPEAEIYFERLAVLRRQIEEWNLPSRPTKQTDPRAKRFKGESVELDAIQPDALRQLVRDAIEQHIDLDRLEVLRAAEESERQLLVALGKAP